uniref:DDE_3 domain-containing protein n=1 Tax=Haemonchus contortus TaxID=6289 RepID=A0A7I4Z6J4_HAECO
MARDMGISRKTIERVVHEDLKMYPHRTQRAAILSASNQQARVEKCRQLLDWTRNKGHHSIVFSGEKFFTVEQQFNAQNVGVIARNAEEADKKGRVVHRAAHPAQVMVWAGVCASGKTPLVIVDPGVKIDKDYYLKTILEDALLPWTNSHLNGRPWTSQQDSAPAHKAKVVQAWCKSELPDFIPAEEWPASSPDLNPLDYNLWSYLESKACVTPHPNLDFLKAALIREWDEINDALLRPVIDAFPQATPRCRPCQSWPNREVTYDR